MSDTVTIDGVSYTIPDTSDEDWGDYTNSYLNAVATALGSRPRIYTGSLTLSNAAVAYSAKVSGSAYINDDSYNQNMNIAPIGDTGDSAHLCYSASDNWLLQSATGAIPPGAPGDGILNGQSNGGAFTKIYLKCTSGQTWTTGGMLPTAFDGPQKFLLPRADNNDYLGGTIPFYFNRTAWGSLHGSNSDLEFSVDGSLYKGSIAAANLVNDYKGQAGAEGGGTALGLCTATVTHNLALDKKYSFAAQFFYTSGSNFIKYPDENIVSITPTSVNAFTVVLYAQADAFVNVIGL
jgi:hypothetical protein